MSTLAIVGRPGDVRNVVKIRLDHIAVAVSDIKAAIEDFEGKLGLACERIETVPSEKSEVAFFDLGGPHLELVSPTDADCPMGRSLSKRGEGLHHICLEVGDIGTAITALKAKGVQLINETPQPGADGSKIAFIHPKSMRGVLVELVEKP